MNEFLFNSLVMKHGTSCVSNRCWIYRFTCFTTPFKGFSCVTIVDNLSHGKLGGIGVLQNLFPEPGRLQFIYSDLGDPKSCILLNILLAAESPTKHRKSKQESRACTMLFCRRQSIHQALF